MVTGLKYKQQFIFVFYDSITFLMHPTASTMYNVLCIIIDCGFKQSKIYHIVTNFYMITMWRFAKK